ncbi:MAG: hypothetical protein N2559_07440 [Anaerolineae bacterium]|nr:hypothetical protein [Anaerolineae bacterium]
MSNLELTFDQLLTAISKMPPAQQVKLWRILGSRLNQDFVRQQARDEFAESVAAIRAANAGVNEDEVMADVTATVLEVRAERRARRD